MAHLGSIDGLVARDGSRAFDHFALTANAKLAGDLR